MYKAFLFDLNGTMINDMSYHVTAWQEILNSLGANMSRQEVRSQCYGSNSELFERVFPGRYSEEEKMTISLDKEKKYQEAYRPHLQLIHGLDVFLAQASTAGIRMAIGSAAIKYNIDYVLDNLGIRRYFDAIVSAEDVQISKPHPQTYLSCANHLGVLYRDCLVFEDSTKGVEAAKSAGMDAVVLKTFHEAEEFEHFSNVRLLVDDFTNPLLDQLLMA